MTQNLGPAPHPDRDPLLEGQHRQLDARIERVLAAPRTPPIAPDFAARVAALAASSSAEPVRTGPRFGPLAVIASALVLMLALLLVGTLLHGSRASRSIELLFSIELATLVVAAGPWRRSLRRLL
jgi:hypothetical protein